MVTTQSIKDLAIGLGMDLCGVASVDRFATSPEGKHPCDVLPGCKSVIVVGVKLLDGIIQANFRDFEDGRRDLKGLYGTYGYSQLPNFELSYVVYNIARHIERTTGEVATPCSTGPMTNGNQISLRHSAVAAGLGQFGWIGIVLTPEFGPRQRWGAILTTLELEPTPMYGGDSLCDPVKCGICTKVCPTNALSTPDGIEPKKVDIGGEHYEYCHIDWVKCLIAEHALTKRTGGKEDLIDPETASYAEMAAVTAAQPLSEAGLQHTESWHCGKCLSYCPAGDWAKRYGKKGLSKGAGAIKIPTESEQWDFFIEKDSAGK